MNTVAVGEKPGFLQKTILYLILWLGAIMSAFPFYWMFVVGTNDRSAVFHIPPKLVWGNLLLTNMEKVIERILFFRSMYNSFILASLETVFVLFFCALAGFAFAKYEFPLKRSLFILVLGTLFVPQQLSLLPNYIIMAKLHWIDDFKAIIVPGMVNAFGIFWMRQYIEAAVSNDLIEAGRIDGCSHFRIFWRIILPIITPALSTLGIFTFMYVWNDFMWPLVVLKSQEHFTLQMTLRQLLYNRDGVDYGMVMAATFTATLPLLLVFLLFNRWFISGLTSGAVKA
ncbi:MAG TPA: carbohydrate ABC transporter permease [Bacilli bacterium]